MIDWERFNEEFVQYFDKAFVLQIIDMFLAEYDARLSVIEQNILDLDFAHVKSNAHDLKSLTGNFRASLPEALARELEQMGAENKNEGLIEVFQKLKPAVIELSQELITYRMTLIS
ncbi:MAG: Hpt domain-containing protein [Bacteroidota bacterium]